MDRSLWAVIGGTFTLRFSTGLTGAMLAVNLAKLPLLRGQEVEAFGVGVFAANGHLAMQFSAVVATAAFSFLGSYAILKLIDGAMGMRVSQEEEATGLDLTQHNERAYS